MQIGTYNLLGLRGYPPEESSAEIGNPGDESNAAHFMQVFAELNCDILALQEGIAVRTIQPIAHQMDCYLATFPSPINWPGHILSRYPILESRIFSHTDPTQATPPFSRTSGAALLSVEVDTTLWAVDIHLQRCGSPSTGSRHVETTRQTTPEHHRKYDCIGRLQQPSR